MLRNLLFAVSLFLCTLAQAQPQPIWFGRPEVYLQNKHIAKAHTITTQSFAAPRCTLHTDSAGRFVQLLIPYDSVTRKDQWREVWRYDTNGDTAFHAILISKNPVADSTGNRPDEIVLFLKNKYRDSTGLLHIEKYTSGVRHDQIWSVDSLLLSEHRGERLDSTIVIYTYSTNRKRETKTVYLDGKLLLDVSYYPDEKIKHTLSRYQSSDRDFSTTFTHYRYNKAGSLKRLHTYSWKKNWRQKVVCKYNRDGKPLRVKGFIANENMDPHLPPLTCRKPIHGKWEYDNQGRLLSFEGTSDPLPLITYHTAQMRYEFIRNFYTDSVNQHMSFVGDRYFINLYSYSQNGNVFSETYYHPQSELDIPLNDPRKSLHLAGQYFKPSITMAWDSFYQHPVYQEYFVSGKFQRDTFIYNSQNQLIRKEKTVYTHATGYAKTTIVFSRNEKGQCITQEISCDTLLRKTTIRYVWNEQGVCLVTDSMGMNGVHSYDSLSVTENGDTTYRYMSRGNKDNALSEYVQRYENGLTVEMRWMKNGELILQHSYTYTPEGLPLTHYQKEKDGLALLVEEWKYEKAD
jgi:hypothetical protein